MRFLAIADTHLGFTTGKTSQAKNFIYEYMFQKFEEALNVAKQMKVDYVFHGGDIFNRSNPPLKVVQRTYQLIESLLKEDIGFLIAPGNHERAILPTTLLRFHPKCNFFKDIATINLNSWIVLGFAYVNSFNKLLTEKITTICKKNLDKNIIIICHQLFDGAVFGPQEFRFSFQHGAINPKIIPNNVSLIISGHIHRAQSLYNGLIIYPGSLERTSFIESIEPKGYLLIEIMDDYLKIDFQKVESFPMRVFEKNLLDEKMDFSELQDIIPTGLSRTLLRFTNRKITTKELVKLKLLFPKEDYPLLTISPKTEDIVLNPLYNSTIKPFKFDSIYKEVFHP